jgi:outer membrane protein TolC
MHSVHLYRYVGLFSLFLLAGLRLTVSDVAAQDQSVFATRLNLATATEKALQTNPRTKASAIGVTIAEAKMAEARSGRLPVVRFDQYFTRSNNPVFVFGSLLEQGRFGTSNFAIDSLNHPEALNNFRSAISVNGSVFDQRRTSSLMAQSRMNQKQAELKSEAARQAVTFDVIQSYYGAVLANELLAVTGEAVRSAKENCRKTRDLVSVGMVTESDALAADVELANAEQQQLESQNDLVTSIAALNIAIGNKPDFPSELVATLQEKHFPVENQDDLIRIALENRPEYLQAALAVEVSREQTRAVKGRNLPRLDAFGSYGYSSPYIANGSADYTVGANLSYTIFDAGRKARVQQAAGAESVAELEQQNLANQIRLEVIRYLQNFKTAGSKIKVSIKSITQADEALRIIQERYKFGLTTFNEVLRAETALVRSKHNLLTARYEYYVSYASILLATGRLTDVRTFD